MRTAGIIAEYNPFHAGHAYHIEQTKVQTGADYIVIILSGDFVQRGAPAFLPKEIRTRMALASGADLVIELPATHACESAEFFARSGVELLHAAGCIDVLSFGSESGQLHPFLQTARYLSQEPAAYKEKLQEKLRSGLSFPAARQQALFHGLSEILPEEDWSSFLHSPNNILGVEYCKALLQLNSSIQPFTLHREGSTYHEQQLSDSLPSASAIRKVWLENPADWRSRLASVFSEDQLRILSDSHAEQMILTEDDFSPWFRWLLYGSEDGQLARYLDLDPQLANRLLRFREQYQSISRYISLVKTKDLTYSRISRAVFHALLDIRELPALSYLRILGFRRQAAPLLKVLKQQASLPILTSPAREESLLSPEGKKLLAQNTRISHWYQSVLCEKYGHSFRHAYTQPLVIL